MPLCSLIGDTVENICKNSCIGSSEEHDDRNTLEIPGTEWIFSCPMIDWLNHSAESKYIQYRPCSTIIIKGNAKNLWAYQFQAPMPVDVSKIDGDIWPSYERCDFLACHASELR